MAETEIKSVETLLCELQDELHYQTYPSDNKRRLYKPEFLQGDYFPLHMVKTVSERYAEQFKPVGNDLGEEHF